MEEANLPPVCAAPSCKDLATVTFMGMTPLCDRHGAKANRRAMVNVLVVGAVFAIVGALLLWIASRLHPAIGGTVIGCGVFAAGLAPFYLRAARKLEGGRG